MRLRKILSLLLALLLIASLSEAALAISLQDWYSQTEGGDDPADVPESGSPDGSAAEQPADAVGFREVKLTSSVYGGAVVGRTVVPDGWTVETVDLTLDPESIQWPNAIYVTVTSPDGSCVMKYLSRRYFMQWYTNMMGFTAASTDDAYDYSEMTHTLDYRDAAGVCDYMVGLLYEGSWSFVEELAISAENRALLQAAREKYAADAVSTTELAGRLTGSNTSLRWADVTMAERTYRSGGAMSTVTAISAGQDIYNDLGGGSFTEYIYWTIEGLCAMETTADAYDVYRPIYEVFTANTGVSQEYISMTEQHSVHLQQYYQMLKEGISVSEQEEANALDSITDETVGSGDSYSVEEAWSDYIRDETDYTTSDGSRIKLPDSYDHVFEGDDGTIYAGNSVDGPAGTVELTPTQIGG